MKTFLSVENAAAAAGLSTRHFRRKMEESGMRIVEIGRKFFIQRTTLENWAADEGVILDVESVESCAIEKDENRADSPEETFEDEQVGDEDDELPPAAATVPLPTPKPPKIERKTTEMKTEETDVNTPEHSLQMPLTHSCTAVVTFHGDYPDKSAVARLQKALDLMLDASTPEIEAAPQQRKARKLKPMGPCEKHPDSPRNPSTNRCVACTKETIEKMHAARRKPEALAVGA